MNKTNKVNKILIILGVITGVVFLSILIFAKVNGLQTYQIDGPSMSPTLRNGQRILSTTKVSELKRYEIVIYPAPKEVQDGGSSSRKLIKRIIALPGEKVQVKDNKVTVYKVGEQTGFDPDAGQSYLPAGTQTRGVVDLTVPPDSVFVLGDDRVNSLDSRATGPVKIDLIAAKLYRVL